ncbi:MAG: NAD(P)H-hydrate dehydratase [Candidatus Hodarchaeota archaeon]
MKEKISLLDMQIADVNAEYLGISRLQLMENAGFQAAKLVQKLIVENNIENLLIVCGSGGNGGDGFVAARHLARSIKPTVLLVGSRDRISQPARTNWQLLQNLKMSVDIRAISSSDNIPKSLFDQSNLLIVDALLGTGVKGRIREPMRQIIHSINKSKAVILSLDIPSGTNPETGAVEDITVQPSIVITFHAIKRGLTEANSGKIICVDIGIPKEAELRTGPGDLILFQRRTPWTYKGKNGQILVIGGSIEYSGAPALAALSALRVGIDLVTVFTSEAVAPTIRNYSPELIVRQYKGDFFNQKAMQTALKLAENMDAILIGPGLGDSPEIRQPTEDIVLNLQKRGKNTVIDAQAIKPTVPLVKIPNCSKIIFTPHAGEFKQLFGVELPSGANNFGERLNKIRKIAKEETKAVLLVKGHWDIIAQEKNYKINLTGIPEMSVGGTGDVLAGLATAFAALWKDSYRAAVASSFINGLAGELYLKRTNTFDVLGLIQTIPDVLFRVQQFIKKPATLNYYSLI